jgi:hypothetical protein
MTSVSAVISSINSQYGTNLPTVFPDGSLLQDIWSREVATVSAPPAFEAQTDPFELVAGFNIQFRIYVRQDAR